MKSIQALIDAAKAHPGGTAAVAAAHDADVLRAVLAAKRAGICDALLIGDGQRIRALLADEGADAALFTLEDTSGEAGEACAQRAVDAIVSGRADFLMKGQLNTTDMLRRVVRSTLVTGRLLSHVMLYEAPGYPRLIANTDGGMNPAPTLGQKADILENAAMLLHALGVCPITAACLSGSEIVSQKIPSTTDAQALAGMRERWAPYGMRVFGPVGLDLAISPAACAHKGYDAPGAGEADILLMPSYEAGNCFGKALTYFAGARSAGIVVGAKAPIVLVSRADDAETKLASLALGVLAAQSGADR